MISSPNQQLETDGCLRHAACKRWCGGRCPQI